MPLLMFFIRIQDPLIAKHVFKPFHRVSEGVRKLRAISKFKTEYFRNERSNSGLSTSLDDSPRKRDSTMATGIALENEILIDDPEDQFWMNLLPARLKEAFARTFIVCASVLYPQGLEDVV